MPRLLHESASDKTAGDDRLLPVQLFSIESAALLGGADDAVEILALLLVKLATSYGLIKPFTDAIAADEAKLQADKSGRETARAC